MKIREIEKPHYHIFVMIKQLMKNKSGNNDIIDKVFS